MDYPCISRPSRRNNLSKIFINFLCHGASILPQSLLANPGAMRDCACILTQSFDRNDVLAAGSQNMIFFKFRPYSQIIE
jgi:hypothetical protein